MPELPEVETVRRGLAPHMEGRIIRSVKLARADLRFPFPPDFEAQLTGARIESMTRRAKYLLAHIRPVAAPKHLWLSHLGMTGRFEVHPAKARAPDQLANYKHALADAVAQKHVHVSLDLDDGTHITYADPRRFGFMDLTPASAPSRFLVDLGPEPMGNEFNADYFLAACAGRQSPVKAVLLDQKTVAGLGNIYVCEALFRAGISPRRKAANLGRVRVARLLPAIRDVLGEAIAAGGSSLRDFADSDGKLGYFQHGFAVYDRAGAPCTTQGCNAKITRIVQSGRSSFYCPACQH
jgi:formamidopyrimidine-DNA glycosylase